METPAALPGEGDQPCEAAEAAATAQTLEGDAGWLKTGIVVAFVLPLLLAV